MFSNFFKTTIRSIWKNKGYNFLNIFGLAIGVACASLIFLWIEDEMNYDNVYAKKDRLYRVLENQTYEGKTRMFQSTPGPLAAAIKQEIPGIVNSARISNKDILLSYGDKAVYEKGCYADTSLFSMLQLPFEQGDPSTALNELHSLVITKSTANKFFDKNENVIGRKLKVNAGEEYVIGGVMKDLPENSTLKFAWIAPMEVFASQSPWITRWGANGLNTYVELSPGADVVAINKQLFDFIEKKQTGATARAFLFAMNDWHLRDKFEDGKQVGGTIKYVNMFGTIAWIILLIACINFMNLATARSEKRAKEVGVRKVLGAGKKALLFRFIAETVYMSFIAVLLGVLIVLLVLPAFNTLVQKQLSPGLTDPSHLLALTGIALLCGVAAGSYPALYLSSFNPVTVFKKIRLKSGGAVFIRKGLVIVQFTISIVLIISTIIIYRQIQHAKNRDIGYEKDKLLQMKMQGDMLKNFTAIRHDLLNTGLITGVGMSDEIMYTGNNSSNYNWQGKDPGRDILISHRMISPEFTSTLGLSLTEGRQFVSEADSSNVIITESLAALMGKGSALGKVIESGGGDYKHTVVGVVKDFVYGDIYTKGEPVMFFCLPQQADKMYVRAATHARVDDLLAKMEPIMRRHNPSYPFTYKFVDEQVNEFFKREMLVGKLSRVFSALAIIISCLGLFGLAAYTAERRVKEIGIRKVLGASVKNVTNLLSKDFMLLVLISAFIAFPLAWWAMHSWLQGYAYRVQIEWWVFLIAAAAAILIALFTVSFQAIKAALANPVKSLRTE
jgi:putative ABC transport system permease protein